MKFVCLPVNDESTLMVGDQVFPGFGSGLKPDCGLFLHGACKLAIEHALRAQRALRVKVDADGNLPIVACWVLEKLVQE